MMHQLFCFAGISSTAILALLGLIIATTLGFFIGKFFRGKEDKDWQLSYESKNEEFNELNKSFKKSSKNINRIKDEKQTWENKYNQLRLEHSPVVDELVDLKSSVSEKQNLFTNLEVKYNQLSSKNERTEKELFDLKKKTKKENKEVRSWNTEIEKWQRNASEYKNKYEATEKNRVELVEKMANHKKFFEEFEQMKIENKSHKHLIKKLNENVTYWEKMHYDTHHELAAAKKSMESNNAQIEKLKMEKNGVKLEKDTMQKMVEDYKSKFLASNNQYRDLLAKTQSKTVVN